MNRVSDFPALGRPLFTPLRRRAKGDAMLNHATGCTSTCKPPLGAGAVARMVH